MSDGSKDARISHLQESNRALGRNWLATGPERHPSRHAARRPLDTRAGTALLGHPGQPRFWRARPQGAPGEAHTGLWRMIWPHSLKAGWRRRPRRPLFPLGEDLERSSDPRARRQLVAAEVARPGTADGAGGSCRCGPDPPSERPSECRPRRAGPGRRARSTPKWICAPSWKCGAAGSRRG